MSDIFRPATMSKSENEYRFRRLMERQMIQHDIDASMYHKFRQSLREGDTFKADLGICYEISSTSSPRYNRLSCVFRIKKLYPWIARVQTIVNQRGNIYRYTCQYSLSVFEVCGPKLRGYVVKMISHSSLQNSKSLVEGNQGPGRNLKSA